MSKIKKDEGIVLKRIDYGEADRIVTVFTKEYGKVSLIAKGVRKVTSRRRGHIEPLTHVNLSFAPYDNLGYLSEAEAITQFVVEKHGLQEVSEMTHVCEMVDKLLPDSEVNEYAFRLLFRALEVLSSHEDAAHRKDVLRLFGVSLLRSLGFWDDEHHAPLVEGKSIDGVLAWQYDFIESITERGLKSIRLAANA